MGAIEQMRILDQKNEAKSRKAKERLDEWDEAEKADWEGINFPSGGLGRGYSTLSRRLGQVRAGDWGMSSGKKKASSLRNQEIL